MPRWLAVFALALTAASASGAPARTARGAPGAARSPEAAAARTVDPDLLAGLAARSIGPAAMSGRIAAVEGVPGDPRTVWVGAATGGVWKSTDGALTFKPVFDDQPVASIGAVAVHPAHPDVVWVGTGEGNPRNSASAGNGVYRTLDAGRTWAHVGLAASERIHRILLDPADPDAATVCALGPTWGDGEERGVFHSADGGRTWTKLLGGGPSTGCADLVRDPANPRKLLAALWDHRRQPWTFRSGGPGSGLFVTHDGGSSWRRLTPEDGLPEGDLGRIGLAIAPSDPRRLYAIVEAEGEKNLLLRSDDGGAKWRTVADDAGEPIGNRPFYFSDLRVDPGDPNRVYSLWSLLSVSEDGGERWEVLLPFARAHPDHHAMWIDPADPNRILEGNDGGVYVSADRGTSWRFVANLPVPQFYHLRLDRETPYHVYGGLQDNGSWRGPAEVWENAGIRNHHWQELNFGDGFDVVPDPDDARQGWAMSQEGYLARYDLATGEHKSVRPARPAGGEELRFNWNAGIAIDPFAAATIYYGSQFVHRSTDRGETWTAVSPDLTTDRAEWQRQDESGGLTLDVTGAENFTTIVAIAPSPLARGMIWVGTDDGRLHRTRDGGATWTSLEGNFRGVPPNAWISHIEPSRHDPEEAFLVLDNHRRSDFAPYVLRTRDGGRTFTRLDTPDLSGWALAIVQDPGEPDLLFLGTEFGLWVSLDGGGRWLRWTHGVPTVAVADLAIEPREDDLVIATHGRGIYVIDDLAPLRRLSAATLGAPLHLFPVKPAQQAHLAQTGSSRFPGDGEFRGENEPYGALVTFSLDQPDLPHPREEKERLRQEEMRSKERAAGGERAQGEGEAGKEPDQPKARITVRDAAGRLVRGFDAPVHQGVNRVVWNLRRDAFREPTPEEPREEDEEPSGPEVPPGGYTLEIAYGGHTAQAPVEVLADPRAKVPAADRQAKEEAVMFAGRLQEAATDAIEGIRSLRADIAAVLAKADRAQAGEEARREAAGEAPGGGGEGAAGEEPASRYKALREQAEEAKKGLAALERRLWVPPNTKGIPPERDAWSQIGRARWLLGSSWDPPTPAQLAYLAEARDALVPLLEEYARFLSERAAPLAAAAAGLDLGLFRPGEPPRLP